ncbi:hypothetical protein [Pseudomonas turukhanskensis]|uniref:hypothetical protein n=1 Tax=Pseudomonas turukhanskensis TaxID=1806536 RepID=UPI0022F2C695|nr:hypothetical protein [Pseudomonas turukhanskensis]
MAATNGGVRIGVTALGTESARRQLASLGKSIDPVLRGTLDTTVGNVRKTKYTPEIAKMFKSRGWVNKRLIIKRVNAKKGRFDARLIPSSAGVYVNEYRKWGYQLVTPTRARILVGSFKGHKVAAGFVNPASLGRQPWSTRSGKKSRQSKELVAAMAPSVAFYFKRLTNSATLTYTNRFMSAEFQRRYRRELLKG